MSEDHSSSHIIQSLLVNIAIAIAKTIAAIFTGSGAMLAEAIHSFADSGNQVLLLIGVRSSKRPANETHPLGYGRDVYFWSFIVALMLFAGGGVFSIYEGFHKTFAPEPVEHVWLGLGILFFSIVLEGFAFLSNIREINRRRKGRGFLAYLHETKDADLIVVFGENGAAVLGLVLAAGALALAGATGDGRWDGAGSLLIGLVLVGVAVFLAKEVKSLLLGESADPEIERVARAIAKDHPKIEHVIHLVTVQQGPGEVLVAIKIQLSANLRTHEICDAINEFEQALRAQVPEARWLYVEPDIPRIETDAVARSSPGVP